MLHDLLRFGKAYLYCFFPFFKVINVDNTIIVLNVPRLSIQDGSIHICITQLVFLYLFSFLLSLRDVESVVVLCIFC